MQQPNLFSISAGVTFPNPEKLKSELAALAREAILKEPAIVAIYLFGSRARGDFSARSDADLLIVLQADNRRVIDRIPDYLRLFLKAPLPVEVFPYTEKELEQNAFARAALQQSILLCSRESLLNETDGGAKK